MLLIGRRSSVMCFARRWAARLARISERLITLEVLGRVSRCHLFLLTRLMELLAARLLKFLSTRLLLSGRVGSIPKRNIGFLSVRNLTVVLFLVLAAFLHYFTEGLIALILFLLLLVFAVRILDLLLLRFGPVALFGYFLATLVSLNARLTDTMNPMVYRGL